ncbi:hypothetical protein [Streptomyces sp. NPDC001774]
MKFRVELRKGDGYADTNWMALVHWTDANGQTFTKYCRGFESKQAARVGAREEGKRIRRTLKGRPPVEVESYELDITDDELEA